MMRLLALLLLLITSPALAQEPPAAQPPTEDPAPQQTVEVDKRFASPRATMTTFLKAVPGQSWQRSDWDAAAECVNFTADELADGTYVDVCRALKDVIDHIELIDLRALPDQKQAEELGITSYRFFPRDFDSDHLNLLAALDGRSAGSIEIGRADSGQWLFTGETVDTILELQDQFERAGISRKAGSGVYEPADYIRRYMPEKLKEKALLVEYWQWLALLLGLLIGLILDHLFRWVVRLAAARYMGAARLTEERRESLARSAKPFGLLVMGLFWIAWLWLISLTPGADKILGGAARVFAVLAGTWALWRLADLVCTVLEARAAKTATRMDDVLVPLIRRALKLFILVFGVIYGAEMASINIMPLLAGLSIGGIAFGFAARDTIENFFGSVAVVIDRPFHVGDWVVIGDTEGTVEAVGFRSTRIRTFYNSLVTVPNANLVRAVVDNYGERKYRRWKTNVAIQYDTPPGTIVAFTEGIRELVRAHPYTRKDYFQVYLNEFADSSLNVLLYVFFEVPDWSTELRERERLFLDIIRLADQLGVRFAFPTQTVHLYKEEHKPHAVQHDVPRSITDRRAQVTGARAAQNIIANQSWVTGEKPGPVIFKAWPRYVEINPETGQPIDPAYKSQIEDTTSGG